LYFYFRAAGEAGVDVMEDQCCAVFSFGIDADWFFGYVRADDVALGIVGGAVSA
jgi:hypothetical protein